MGSPKALLDVRGRPAVELVIGSLAQGGADPIVLVVGKHAREIRDGASLESARVLDHPGWASGRTGSIQAGLAALPADAAAVVLALVDMPLIAASSIRALISAFEPASDVDFLVPEHDGRRGHPILLARSLFERIGELDPDRPLRDLLRNCTRKLVPVDDPGVLLDLNSPQDLADL